MTLPTDATKSSQFQIPRKSLPREIVMLFTVCSAQGLVQALLVQSFLPDLVI